MSTGLRHRFWLESALASATGIMTVVTIFWRDWIETVFGIDPDKGNGSAEWLVVVILAILTALLAVGARSEWHRARHAES
jgi:hypothetical protein